ncbi:MAG TPA: tetratricopeptide repeat protein [Bryobacteraceae bacterium]|nr:tetratricopeptide repeat protein [Bryobacteraceae bacterium]
MKLCCTLAIAVICCGCAQEHKPSGSEIIHSADAAWRRGDFLSAAAAYEQASNAAPQAPEPLYDLALAYYRDKLYDLTRQYLDRVQPSATGELRVRCLLLRGNAEYRLAMQQQLEERVRGLERALHLYREAAEVPGSPLNEIARYNVEVVKLKLPASHPQGQGSQPAFEVDETSAEDIAFRTKMAPKDQSQTQKPASQDRDW